MINMTDTNTQLTLDSVGCQVFHYCVDGVKHSWQCPENTVFHQIHLNCVPNTQDICGESSKFHVVNDYLHKVTTVLPLSS